MDRAQVRVDADGLALLGEQAVGDLAGMLDAHGGECVVCHQPFGPAPVSLAVHVPDDADSAVLVLPGHAACQPSTLTRHRTEYMPFGPSQTYAVNAIALHMQSEGHGPDEERGRSWRRPKAAPAMVPAVLVNPSIDVQHGRIVDGHWRNEWEDSPELYGLTVVRDNLAPAGPPLWGARINDGGTLTVSNSLVDYQVRVVDDYAGHLRQAGQVLVLVTDVVHAGDDSGVDLRQVMAAGAAGRLFAAWAKLGADPVPHEFAPAERPSPAAASLLSNPTARSSRSTADITAEVDDVDVNVRATFHDHPAVALPAVAVGDADGRIHQERVPVLLLEPRRAVMLTHPDHDVVREGRVEAAISGGLDRALPAAASILNEARDWRLTSKADLVELHNPAGQVTARAQLHRYPPGWLDAAGRLGAVLVIYGPQVGVRPPQGRSYNDRDRRAELDDSRRAGLAAWGIVSWHRDQ